MHILFFNSNAGKNLANGKFSEFGVQPLMIGLTVLSASCTFAILADKLHLGPIIEILATAGGIQGGYKYLDPVGAGKNMLGSDLSDKRKFRNTLPIVYIIS